MSSGRISIWKASIQIYSEASFVEQLIGMGIIEFKNKMFLYRGTRIFAHNGFINLLCIHGLIGLIIFILFLYNLYKDIKNKTLPALRPLGYSLFTILVVFTFFQSANYPLQLIFIIFPIIWSQRLSRNQY